MPDAIRSVPPIDPTAWPLNPVQVRVLRGGLLESVHRGAWVLVDEGGSVVEASGQTLAPIFARSAVKAFQALPLIESGAAARFAYRDEELALALASHDAEHVHLKVVSGVLARLGLETAHLGCGPQMPADRAVRRELDQRGEKPSALHNNCSGKHAGFLALALHLGVPTERYLEADSAGQVLARAALTEMAGLRPEDIQVAVDGCSAPTFRLPLAGLATAFARLAAPQDLAPERRAACERMQRAVAAHPDHIAGNHRRLCTAIVRASGGRLFPKIGAEGVYAVGRTGGPGRGRGFALKMDDGQKRGLEPLVVQLLERFGWLERAEFAHLEEYRGREILNRAGRLVGATEVDA